MCSEVTGQPLGALPQVLVTLFYETVSLASFDLSDEPMSSRSLLNRSLNNWHSDYRHVLPDLTFYTVLGSGLDLHVYASRNLLSSTLYLPQPLKVHFLNHAHQTSPS